MKIYYLYSASCSLAMIIVRSAVSNNVVDDGYGY